MRILDRLARRPSPPSEPHPSVATVREGMVQAANIHPVVG